MFSKASTCGITVRPTVTPAIASDTAFSLIIEFMIHGYFLGFWRKISVEKISVDSTVWSKNDKYEVCDERVD